MNNKQAERKRAHDAATLDRLKLLGVATAIVMLPLWITVNSGDQNESDAVKELEYNQCMRRSIDRGADLEGSHSDCKLRLLQTSVTHLPNPKNSLGLTLASFSISHRLKARILSLSEIAQLP